MIITIEGARHSGKTYLLNKFFEQNSNPRFKYYKWFLVDWLKILNLESREQRADVHYLSIGNILTIFDQMHKDKETILVFDRSLITAYAWAILRQRLTESRAQEELKLVLSSEVYKNIITIVIDPNPLYVKSNERHKDLFDSLSLFKDEYDVIDKLTLYNRPALSDPKLGNRFIQFNNEFDQVSIDSFIGLIDSFSNR